MTKIVKGYPPNYAEVKARFHPPLGTIFAWEDRIYSPHAAQLPEHLVVHERTHFKQQLAVGGAEAWWRRYIDDSKFRLEQEVEAYRAQWAVVRDFPRPERREILAHICKSLASGMYGRLVTKAQARDLIVGPAA